MSEFKNITITELHPTFGAEVSGIADYENLTEEQLEDLRGAIGKYGVLLLRSTKLTDTTHIRFTRLLAKETHHSNPRLDTITRYLQSGRKLRYPHVELFDASNLDDTNTVVHPSSVRAHSNRGSTLFHVDSSFNPRRASLSILRAAALPPPSTGGNTDFADTRTAWDDLPSDLKTSLLKSDFIGAHNILHSKKLASPEFFNHVDVSKTDPMARHRIVQRHEPSGRMNLYIGAHLHHLEGEGMTDEKSAELIDMLNEHATQDKYVLSVPWKEPGDVVIWDNRAVMHRAGKWTGEGKYARDLRRTTVHDDGAYAWGENEVGAEMPSFGGLFKPGMSMSGAATGVGGGGQAEGVKV